MLAERECECGCGWVWLEGTGGVIEVDSDVPDVPDVRDCTAYNGVLCADVDAEEVDAPAGGTACVKSGLVCVLLV